MPESAQLSTRAPLLTTGARRACFTLAAPYVLVDRRHVVSDVTPLRDRLRTAQVRLQEALAALAPKHRGGEMEEYREASAACLAAERELALAEGRETAMACDWPAPWDTGAPLPIVLASDSRTLLLYIRQDAAPYLPADSVHIVNPSDSEELPLAIVEFVRSHGHRFGSPNDEVFHGHPLYGRGLDPYGAHLVLNSRWITEVEAINSVHSQYDPVRWRDLKHYLLLFHDSTFECIARGHELQLLSTTYVRALAVAHERLLE
jgi:hypothetical protein